MLTEAFLSNIPDHSSVRIDNFYHEGISGYLEVWKYQGDAELPWHNLYKDEPGACIINYKSTYNAIFFPYLL